jgi:hypothetical protein
MPLTHQFLEANNPGSVPRRGARAAGVPPAYSPLVRLAHGEGL